MALFLVQHGLSLSKDLDPEKGLSKAGEEVTQRIADVAKAYAINVTKIVHSNKKRAVQTAAIFQDTLQPTTSLEKMSGIQPLDPVIPFGDRIDPTANLMVVGHLPFMEKLVSYLTAGIQDIRVYKFQNSGIVCLDREDNDWYIKWTLNPTIS
ncbi:phosphohistidine phosphatase SixA [Desulfobacula sp.]|uniref:phosphohistidine phosphatase SixA n=1 Tax=Desulfobacula sp. TaxID=2593537 RepID=UPI002619C4A8|nr:phosphohistidine phosphatase SixA [Desulfobacula sp.]